MKNSLRTINIRSLEYLAFLVAKYNMSPTDFAEGLLKVIEKGEATCGPLHIECRQNNQENAIFLVTLGDAIVSQFSLTRKFLEGFEKTKNRFTDICNIIKQRGGYSLNPMVQIKIRDLRVGARNVRLVAKVSDKSPSKRVISRNGKELTISNIILADETGSIKLPLWNEQIDLVAKGDTVQIENASVRLYRGERQLNIGYKRGKISVLEPAKIAPVTVTISRDTSI